MAYRFIAAGGSHVGRQRKVNEDSFLVLNQHQLCILADGMGGHAAGQLASQMAVEEISRFMVETLQSPQFTWPFDQNPQKSYEENTLINATRVANVRIYNQALKDPQCSGMGTTLVATKMASNGEVVIAAVGDSRCYVYRQKKLSQLTRDHSLLNHLIYQLKMDPEEARKKAGKNVIVKAVGLEDDVEVDTFRFQPYPNDVFLLCSDGLTDLVEESQVERVLQQYGHNLNFTIQHLIELANEGGGTDNITIILLQIQAPQSPSNPYNSGVY
jgi:protein phosphatase